MLPRTEETWSSSGSGGLGRATTASAAGDAGRLSQVRGAAGRRKSAASEVRGGSRRTSPRSGGRTGICRRGSGVAYEMGTVSGTGGAAVAAPGRGRKAAPGYTARE